MNYAARATVEYLMRMVKDPAFFQAVRAELRARETALPAVLAMVSWGEQFQLLTSRERKEI